MPMRANNPAATSESTPETKQGSAVASELICRSHFEFLARERSRACVSIFLPTHRSAPESKQDQIRLKDLVRQAESELKDIGFRPVKVREILAPARKLIERDGFW